MIRAAAYCRVSTEKEEQLQSLENQRSYFERYIGQHPDWTFAGIYVDEGASGTSAARRQGFMRMLRDAAQGRFDLLLTKEISRFARNTLDSIYYTRRRRAARPPNACAGGRSGKWKKAWCLATACMATGFPKGCWRSTRRPRRLCG